MTPDGLSGQWSKLFSEVPAPVLPLEHCACPFYYTTSTTSPAAYYYQSHPSAQQHRWLEEVLDDAAASTTTTTNRTVRTWQVVYTCVVLITMLVALVGDKLVRTYVHCCCGLSSLYICVCVCICTVACVHSIRKIAAPPQPQLNPLVRSFGLVLP